MERLANVVCGTTQKRKFALRRERSLGVDTLACNVKSNCVSSNLTPLHFQTMVRVADHRDACRTPLG